MSEASELEHITIPLRGGDLELTADGVDETGRLLLVDRAHGIEVAIPWETFYRLAEIHDVVMLVTAPEPAPDPRAPEDGGRG
jgi:hypothetical protein